MMFGQSSESFTSAATHSSLISNIPNWFRFSGGKTSPSRQSETR